MKGVTASKLEAQRLSSLDEMAEAGQRAAVPERGKVSGGLVDFANDQPYPQAGLEGSARALGNVVVPVVEPDDWEALA